MNAADKVTAKIKWLTTQANSMTQEVDFTKLRAINLDEVPRFQIMGQAKYWPDHPRFNTVDHFFSAFENVIHAYSNEEINIVWNTFPPRCLLSSRPGEETTCSNVMTGNKQRHCFASIMVHQ